MKAEKAKRLKRCRTGEHVFSEYVETVTHKGIERIVARCPVGVCRSVDEVEGTLRGWGFPLQAVLV